MASAITETETYESQVIGPDDGDTRNAASVRVGMEDLANRTKYLKAKHNAHGQLVVQGRGSGTTGTSPESFVSGTNITSTTFVTVSIGGNLEVTLTDLKLGDIVQLEAHLFAMVGGSQTGYLKFSDGGGGTTSYTQEVFTNTAEDLKTLIGRYVMTADAASRTFAVQGAVSAAGTLTPKGPAIIMARVIRP